MSKGVGKAMEKAISPERSSISEPEEQKDIKFEFMNKNRQEIYSYLCLHPCSYSTMISKATKLSLHTVNWHMRRLVDAGYVSKARSGKKTVFFPKEMISHEDIPILEVLNIEKAKSIYISIAQNGGIFQGELCTKLNLKHQAVIWYAKKLEALKLTSSLEDGKYRRYYPTDLLNKKKDGYFARMKMFRDWLIKRFENDNMSPTILRSNNDMFVVRIRRGKIKAVLRIHTNPFVTILS